jgi:hypothetical protein
MSLTRIFTVLALLFTLTACASTPALRPEVGARLKVGKVAAAVYIEEKTINYEELVYKVMWNENRRQEVTFGSLWDIDRDLSEKLAKEMKGIGLSAVAANKILPDIDFKVLSDALAATHASRSIPATTNTLEKPLELSSDMREQLRQAGIDYLIAMRSPCIRVMTGSFSFGHVAIMVPSTLIVYDVTRAREEFRGFFGLGGNLAYDETPHDIEKHGLAQLRKAMHLWMAIAVKARMQETLSLN